MGNIDEMVAKRPESTMLRSHAFFIASAWIALAIWITGGTLEMAGYANIGAFGGLLVHWAGCRKKQKGPRHPEG